MALSAKEYSEAKKDMKLYPQSAESKAVSAAYRKLRTHWVSIIGAAHSERVRSALLPYEADMEARREWIQKNRESIGFFARIIDTDERAIARYNSAKPAPTIKQISAINAARDTAKADSDARIAFAKASIDFWQTSHLQAGMVLKFERELARLIEERSELEERIGRGGW